MLHHSRYLVLVPRVLDCLQCSLVLVSRVLDCLQCSWYLVLGPLVLVVLVVRGGSDTMDKWPLLPSQARRLKQKLHKVWLDKKMMYQRAFWCDQWSYQTSLPNACVIQSVVNSNSTLSCLTSFFFPVLPILMMEKYRAKTKIFEFTIFLFCLLC